MIRPILFNTDMVRAILDKRKNTTRRIVKSPYFVDDSGAVPLAMRTAPKGGKLERQIGAMPYPDEPYKIADILYVRETWSTHYTEDSGTKLVYCYKADGIDLKAECLPEEWNRWYPSIHMPKEAARIWLKVTDVRVEQLQEITPGDAWKEGARCTCMHPVPNCAGNKVEFVKIWDSTIKKSDLPMYEWNANPWVWVIEFERCEKPNGWCV